MRKLVELMGVIIRREEAVLVYNSSYKQQASDDLSTILII